MLLGLGALQGCGLIAISHAGYLEHHRLQAANGKLAVDRRPQAPSVAPACATMEPAGCPLETVSWQLPPARPASAPLGAPRIDPLQVAGIGAARGSTDLAPVLLPMAHLSNIVYHRHETEPADRTDPERACGAGRVPHPMGPRLLAVPAVGMASPAAPGASPMATTGALHGGWRRWGAANTHCNAEADTGLFYDTYLRVPGADEAPSAALQVAIVFRGTENDRHQAGFDWTDNFLSAFGITPRQYLRAIERLQVTMAALTELESQQQAQGRALHIYAAGHSLGGGLAQQAAYLHGNIRAVYAFNTSVVTNWTQLRLWDGGVHIQNHEPVIVRVEQDGEFLENLRNPVSWLQLPRFHRVDLVFHFTNHGAARNHSIARLSCHLAARTASAWPTTPTTAAAGSATAPPRPALFGSPATLQAMARAILQAPRQDKAEVGCDEPMKREICERSPYLGIGDLVCTEDRPRSAPPQLSVKSKPI